MKRKTPVKKLLEAPEVLDLVVAASWLLDRAEIYLDTVGNESNASAVDDVRRFNPTPTANDFLAPNGGRTEG